MIIELKDRKEKQSLKKNVDKIIESTQAESEQLEDLLETAPQILCGYRTFRSILRSVKRGNELDNAVETYALEACPPKQSHDMALLCGDIPCAECWKKFVISYSENLE